MAAALRARLRAHFAQKFGASCALEPRCSLHVLQASVPTGVRADQKERHLSESDFYRAFRMSRLAFAAMPKWRQQHSKRQANLF